MPKLWLALFFGYKGTNFHGMQFQLEDHVTTVEDLLVEKLYPAGFLSTNHHGQLQKQQRWSRAARTDKGVHAVINAVSALFTIDQAYFHEDHTLNRIKLDLDLRQLFEGTEIVFHCFRRVTNRFEVRHSVKSRHYCYVCPKSLFFDSAKKDELEPEQIEKTPMQVSNQKEEGQEQRVKYAENEREERSQAVVEWTQGQRDQGSKQRQLQLLGRIRRCCEEFVGSHNFHNYSKNLRAKDPQAQRYIHRFEVDELDENNLIFNIIGQSFIYHQIRKMIGCIIMTFINNYPASYIPNTFFRNQIHMPLAPAAGLYLSSLSFENYNQKKNIPEPLTFEDVSSISPLSQVINQFILSQGTHQWTEWVVKLKQSIYHGIEYLGQEEKESLPGKLPQED